MIIIMESLNDALKKNMLDSNQAIKRLTELKVCNLNIDKNIPFNIPIV